MFGNSPYYVFAMIQFEYFGQRMTASIVGPFSKSWGDARDWADLFKKKAQEMKAAGALATIAAESATPQSEAFYRHSETVSPEKVIQEMQDFITSLQNMPICM